MADPIARRDRSRSASSTDCREYACVVLVPSDLGGLPSRPSRNDAHESSRPVPRDLLNLDVPFLSREQQITMRLSHAPLLLPRPLVSKLMAFYDYPHPLRRGHTIRGYDRPHAIRTARMCVSVAGALGHEPERLRLYQTACLLHDLGRAGLDRVLFGRIWSWAKQRGIPTRPREWRARHPNTKYGHETEAFLERYRDALEADGIRVDAWTKEQIEMRLGYARRLAKRLRIVRPRIRRMGLRWAPWMQQVMLYYYYPERLKNAKPWVKQLAEILVACEQFEAYSNQRRGRDYYVRTRETLVEAFAYLDKLQQEGILGRSVMQTLRRLAARGTFDAILEDARGRALTGTERHFLRSMEGCAWR